MEADLASVLVDTRWQGMHGIGRYSYEVFRRLEGYTRLDSKRIRPASLADPAWLSFRLRRERPSLFFSPAYAAAIASPFPQLLVIHDLIHLEVSEEKSA